MLNKRALAASASKGFTLIELAVVIAIVAILAAVAIPRLVDTTADAERAVFTDFKNKLGTSAQLYMIQQRINPVGFTDFVTDANPPTGNFTVSVAPLGAGVCGAPTGPSITCNFRRWSVTYNWNGGAIVGNAAPTGGNPATAFTF
jgi:prepilin-type N-terminal cleavage/methylation domain-containing protein